MTAPTPEQVFTAFHALVAKWEGGLTDHPSDPGGITNFGISIVFLQDVASTQEGRDFLDRIDVSLPVTPNTIRRLTSEQAKNIMKYEFWLKPNLSELPPLVSGCLYDLGVNAGMGRSAIILQEAINHVSGRSVIANYAGNVGPLTRRYAHELASAGRQLELVMADMDKREAWYRRLVEQKPSSQVFLKGWLNRTNDCRATLVRLAAEWGIA